MELGRITPTIKTGHEHFHLSGESLPDNLLGFWQWSSSNILANAMRGILAEYIVAMDIGGQGETRNLWDAYDLLTSDGIKVEVKSASYLQSWAQTKHSDISFGIQPTSKWTEEGVSPKKQRQADIYVFSLLAHKDKTTVDPLDLGQWEFYVLATEVLNRSRPNQKKISLSRLLRLDPIPCRYGEISNAIRQLYPDVQKN